MSVADIQKENINLKSLNSKTIGVIYDQYFSEVYRYVLYRINDELLAEDIASDVFIRLLEAVKASKGPQTNRVIPLQSAAAAADAGEAF